MIVSLVALALAGVYLLHEWRQLRAVVRAELPSDAFRRLWQPTPKRVPASNYTQLHGVTAVSASSSFSLAQLSFAPGAVWPVDSHSRVVYVRDL